MSQLEVTSLLGELTRLTGHNEQVVRQKFLPLSPGQQQWKPAPGKWSIAECLEHLNLYGRFYIPTMNKAIDTAKPHPPARLFSPGLLGTWMVNAVRLDANAKVKFSLSAPENYNPALVKPSLEKAIPEFIEQQQQLLSLLERSKNVDMEKVKVPISVSRWVRLHLGDCLMLVIYHNERHIVQAERVLSDL